MKHRSRAHRKEGAHPTWLNSATGELLHIDRATGQREVVNLLPGFARGMTRCGDYLFIALSKLRHQDDTFGDLPIAKRSIFCGIVALHLPSGHIVGHLRYLNTCEEIYDIQVLPSTLRPGILNLDNDTYQCVLNTPQGDFWGRQ